MAFRCPSKSTPFFCAESSRLIAESGGGWEDELMTENEEEEKHTGKRGWSLRRHMQGRGDKRRRDFISNITIPSRRFLPRQQYLQACIKTQRGKKETHDALLTVRIGSRCAPPGPHHICDMVHVHDIVAPTLMTGKVAVKAQKGHRWSN